MTPWPTLTASPAATSGHALPWQRLPATGPGRAASWPPPAPPASAPGETPSVRPAEECPAPRMPDLLFDEAEVARLTAAAATAAELEGRRAAREEVAAREAAALEGLAAELLRARTARRDEDLASRRQLARVATAVARAFAVAGGGDPDRALAAVTAMLEGLPEVTSARLVVDPPTAAVLEARLPDLARRAGFPIALEVDRDAGRAPGAMHLVWDGGWADHDPGEIGRRIADLLAVHAAPQSAPETADGQHRTLEPAGAAL